MKRAIALCMVLMLLMGVVAFAQEADENLLIVGSTTQMNGSFFTNIWGNNTADMDVRVLLHDASTVAWMESGNYAINENIVQQIDTQVNMQTGNHTYKFIIRDDMKFSDGSAITAKDYVFSILLQSAPQMAQLQAQITNYSHLVGWDAFAAGSKNVFSGVRFLSNTEFQLTVKAECLPYFYELSLVEVTPYPMAVIAPGCNIRDDGEGAYITGSFTEELLQKTVLDPVTGYRSHPQVVSGAYTLTSYNEATHVARFAINPYYMGNYEGQMPSIEKLEFREVKNETMLDQLLTGEIGLINKVTQGAVITQGQAAYMREEITAAYYLRSGLSMLAFACERDLPSSSALRKAIALTIDSQLLCDTVLNGYGQPVYGYYGFGQWMVGEMNEELLALDYYEQDINAALDMLIKEGWTLNERGEEFVVGMDTLRYRVSATDATLLEPLVLKMAKPVDNDAADAVEAQLREGFKVLGAALEVTALPMAQLLQHYYRQVDRTYDMFFVATNFSYIFDPYYTYHTADEYQGVMNRSGLRDEQLMQLALEMSKTAPDDIEAYAEKWLEFQTRFVEVLPLVPLYSNVYFDYFRNDLYNYSVMAYSTWSSAILYATFEEPADVEGDSDTIIMF